ncbi:hypothetical protein [Modestobacter versicolor]|uniref:Uncharacterized protein n=1 Tax=Modestobacter versicolor TaxID=429133 RepID=A0A323V9V3_9ACTN|nr:hypothetical protein [Modestobacter versicolor]MBB3676263.1 hypothetical protein [Modestobacter versicolor]PZA20880.1 hypothetical protein DMO24_13190 [Modestobacter versicolor]
MSLAPTSTVPLPEAPGAPRRRRRWRGAVAAFVVGLAVPAGVVVADRTGEPLSWSSDEDVEDTLVDEPGFLDGDRLERSLAAMVADAGTSQVTQLAFDDDRLSVDLLDADTGLYARHEQYAGGSSETPYVTDLVRQPPPEAAFDLAAVPTATLLAALRTANRSLGDEPEDVEYLAALVERPFPVYGDPLVVVDAGYGVTPRRVWLALDGSVLRVEGP